MIEMDAQRERCARLATQMSEWLSAPVSEDTPMDDAGGVFINADLWEWCRAARDELEMVARG
jgi:hypothetical protein